MIPVPPKSSLNGAVRVWLAAGRTDMRRGMNGLSLQVQETLGRDPFGLPPVSAALLGACVWLSIAVDR